jgi:serine/threonine-protein kinase HipA
MPARESEDAVRRFADAHREWLIAGTDAHAKNYSLLLAGDQVRLAPLYDVAPAPPYPDLPVRRLRFAMRLGGDYRVELCTGRRARAASARRIRGRRRRPAGGGPRSPAP